MEKSKRSFLPWGMVPTILTLAWPTMLEELMQTAVQYIDTAMVGAIGTQATAAVGATSTVNWLIGSTVAAIGVGFLSFVSQACGAGDTKRAGKASSQAVLAVLVSSGYLLAVGWMQTLFAPWNFPGWLLAVAVLSAALARELALTKKGVEEAWNLSFER